MLDKEMNQDLRNNPEIALDLIQEYLERANEEDTASNFESGDMNSYVPNGKGDLYQVQLQTVRTDTHLVRANNPEEAMNTARKQSDTNNLKQFHRRHDILKPIVVKVPNKEDLEKQTDHEELQVNVARQDTTEHAEITRLMKQLDKEGNTTLDRISQFLKDASNDFEE